MPFFIGEHLPATVPAANHSIHPSSSSPNQHRRSCLRSCAANNGGADSADHQKKQWPLSGCHNCITREGKLVHSHDRYDRLLQSSGQVSVSATTAILAPKSKLHSSSSILDRDEK
ncbi:hypothetical protein Nepgr_003015 [Nepenthes gracilis]|uniref:Uncharacterized protein n=1 Tax=Nepenthes gracilis TaxID=150966 RepID=A0AAD3RYR0_NEPGR|nr:hypothetical protein Nepgr_003015 [Nepenthes gracilis]